LYLHVTLDSQITVCSLIVGPRRALSHETYNACCTKTTF